MTRSIAAFASVAVTVAFLAIIHVAAALPAPLQWHAVPAGGFHQPTLFSRLNQLQPLAERAISTGAPIVKSNYGAWTTAELSVSRDDLVATSLPSHGLALFAGGSTGWQAGTLLRKQMC